MDLRSRLWTPRPRVDDASAISARDRSPTSTEIDEKKKGTAEVAEKAVRTAPVKASPDVAAPAAGTARNLLLRVSGAPSPGRTGLVEGEGTRFRVLAVILLVVDAVVLGAVTLALVLGLGLIWPFGVAVAVVLAGLVACVHRYVIPRVNTPDRRDNVAALIAGSAVSLLVGGIIAASVCVGAYRSDIDTERAAAAGRQVDAEKKPLLERANALQRDVDEALRPRPDPVLDGLRSRLAAKEDELDRARRDLRDEGLGRHGTGAGRRVYYREYEDDVKQRTGERDAVLGQVTKAETAAQEAADERAKRPRDQRDVVTKQLQELEDQRTQQVASVRSDDASGRAQLARVATLFSLLFTTPVGPAFWGLLVFCLLVQSIPVLLRMGCGPTILDDQALRDAHVGVPAPPRKADQPPATVPPRQRGKRERA